MADSPDPLVAALAEAGGVGAARGSKALLRRLLLERLAHGAEELARARSGYERPVLVGVAPGEEAVLGVCPVAADLRADPQQIGERAWLLAAGLVGSLVEATAALGGPPSLESRLRSGAFGRWLALELPVTGRDVVTVSELAAETFTGQISALDRLRAVAVVLPPHLLEEVADLRPPLGAAHPLLVAEAVARLGGRPADPGSVAEREDAVLELLGAGGAAVRPHDDPDDARRVARRILQRLSGMGKWGGYHTNFDHLPRGFQGNDRRLARDVGESLLRAGLLAEKLSVGQRHVFLNPRRAADIHSLIEDGRLPEGLDLPSGRDN